MSRFGRVFCLCAFGMFIIQPLTVFAQTMTTSTTAAVSTPFDPNRILDDSDMFNVNGMNLAQIQDFLRGKGMLGSYRTTDTDGVEKSAADIVWRVATSYHMNAKYLLALIQKEQSLVEDPSPTQKQFDWAAGFAICDSCSMNDPTLQQFKGFASQIEWAAKQHREKYLLQILGRGTTISGYAAGKTTVVDGTPVTPANNATAMLYTYTPHLHGNVTLWNIWQRWFGLVFPDGTVVRGKTSGMTYLIRFGEKRPFTSRAAAASMVDPQKVLVADDSQLAAYPFGKPIAFANYSLIQTPNGKRYLIVNAAKRLIANRKTFAKFGFNEDEVLDASEQDAAAYDDGQDITTATVYPAGLLARDAKNNIWYVEDGTRHLVLKKLQEIYFHAQPTKLLTAAKFVALVIGDPYRLHDGELVRVSHQPDVFVMENGQRRPIPSGKIFEELGWKWNNVLTLPTDLLKDYPIGQPVASHIAIAGY